MEKKNKDYEEGYEQAMKNCKIEVRFWAIVSFVAGLAIGGLLPLVFML